MYVSHNKERISKYRFYNLYRCHGMKQILYIRLIVLLSLLPLHLEAVEFSELFIDSTLRIDYTYAGNSLEQMIAVKDIKTSNHWYGRRNNLSATPLKGNGSFTLYSALSNRVLYRGSFSSLFQEWLTTPEAKEKSSSFEFTLLMPKPKCDAYVVVELYNNVGEVSASLKHFIKRDDILIHDISTITPTPHKYIHRGKSERVIDVAILAEGYTKREMRKFLKDANIAAQEILSYLPFSIYRENFNFIAVMTESDESGVSIPYKGVWRNTAMNSHFSTFYSDRYLTTNSIHQIHNLLSNIPYEHIIVIANTDDYGGGGIYNSLTLTSHHKLFRPVLVHEFGHAFGGLADEYFYTEADVLDSTYNLMVEPWEPNITTLVDFRSKWSAMIPDSIEKPTIDSKYREANYTVGLYEGGGYQSSGIYRPAVVCRMRDNLASRFCPVCEEAIERMIRFHIMEIAPNMSRTDIFTPSQR